MSLKQEIETWVVALGHYDNNEFEEALTAFDNISDTSKILFNCGIIHATLGEHEKAVECYQRAVRLDQYLAVAYFQQGVSNFLVGDFEEALANFNDTLLYLRGNTFIDYEQLGLKFKLYSCEVLFNRGLCYIYLQQVDAGMGDLSYAAKEKVTEDHEVIDEAIREQAQGYTVFSIPVGMVYRPNSAKVKNLQTKDYLGRARLVAAADRGNVTIGFEGADRKKFAAQNIDERSPEQLSFAAQNLVRPDLISRGSQRQQSAPPINRNVFPPTPPPEGDRPTLQTAQTSPAGPKPISERANSVRNPHRPPPQAQRAQTEQQPRQQQPDQGLTSPQPPEPLRPRLGAGRTASESRAQFSPRQSTRGQRQERENRDYQDPRASRGRLYREMPPHGEEDEYPDEVYDLYSDTAQRNPYTAAPTRPRHRSRSRQPVTDYVNDEDDNLSPSVSSSLDDFEILNNAGGTLSRPLRDESRSRGTSRSRRQVDVRTVRVKLHAGDETRYLMVSTTILFEEFLDRVREKLELQKRFKVRIRDEGDLITMGDRDDWELAVATSRREARKGGAEMGKMEVWAIET